MRPKMFVVLLALAAFVALARGQDDTRPRAVEYLGESGGALVSGALIGAGAAGAVELFNLFGGLHAKIGSGVFVGVSSPFIAAAAVFPAGCAYGATLVGEALNVDGNTGLAFGGAYIGLGLGVVAGLATRRAVVGLVGVGALVPAGAVIGYNIGRARDAGPSSLGGRFFPPAVALRARPDLDHQARTVVDCRLMTMRF